MEYHGAIAFLTTLPDDDDTRKKIISAKRTELIEKHFSTDGWYSSHYFGIEELLLFLLWGIPVWIFWIVE